jgi:hypothetical protein
MRHPVLMPVWQMNKKIITHKHTEQCWLSDVQHFGLSICHHQAQVKIREKPLTNVFIKKCIHCKIVIVEPVHLMDHHNISNTLDGIGMLGLWEQHLVTCHLVQYFDSGTWLGQRKPATKIFDLSVLIFGSCLYVYLSQKVINCLSEYTR